jgi:prophage antirepressor-like protein
MNELMIFEGNEVEIILGENNEPLFELYSTGAALGYVNKRKNSTGKEYISPYKSRIDKTVKSAGITCVCQGVTQYLTEEQLYDFMLEARTEKCKSFRKWVTHEVLPQIRATGGFIPIKEEDSEAEIMAKALLIAQKTIEKKDKLIAKLEPKAEIYDRFIDNESTWGLRELRKELESTLGCVIKETDLKQILKEKGWIGNTTKALAYAIRNQYMVTKDIKDRFGTLRTQDRFTSKAREELLDYYKINN